MPLQQISYQNKTNKTHSAPQRSIKREKQLEKDKTKWVTSQFLFSIASRHKDKHVGKNTLEISEKISRSSMGYPENMRKEWSPKSVGKTEYSYEKEQKWILILFYL